MSGDRIAERTAEILALSKNHPRVRALSKADRETWARTQAENDLSAVPYLPGGLSWSKIEATYRKLAGKPPGLSRDGRPFRRHRPGEPSRPETAAALMTSPATLRRACLVAGRDSHWPPRGL